MSGPSARQWDKHGKVTQRSIISNNFEKIKKTVFVPRTVNSLSLLLVNMATFVPRANDLLRCYSKNVLYIFDTVRKMRYIARHLKPMSTTRRESRVKSVKPIRFQSGRVHDDLWEINDSTKIKSDATSLVNNEFIYESVLSTVI